MVLQIWRSEVYLRCSSGSHTGCLQQTNNQWPKMKWTISQATWTMTHMRGFWITIASSQEMCRYTIEACKGRESQYWTSWWRMGWAIVQPSQAPTMTLYSIPSTLLVLHRLILAWVSRARSWKAIIWIRFKKWTPPKTRAWGRCWCQMPMVLPTRPTESSAWNPNIDLAKISTSILTTNSKCLRKSKILVIWDKRK